MKGKELIFLIFKIEILFANVEQHYITNWSNIHGLFHHYLPPKNLQPSAEPWIMNTRRSIGRVYFRSIWIFTVNLFCRGKTGRMNRWIMIADEQDSFEFSCVIAFLGDCGFSIYPWRQCFLLLRMHTNNFHPLSLWLCNHFKLQRFIHRVIQFHVYIFQVTGLLRFIIFLKLVVKVTCHEIALYHCETSYYKILFLYYYDILEKNFLEGIEI